MCLTGKLQRRSFGILKNLFLIYWTEICFEIVFLSGSINDCLNSLSQFPQSQNLESFFSFIPTLFQMYGQIRQASCLCIVLGSLIGLNMPIIYLFLTWDRILCFTFYVIPWALHCLLLSFSFCRNLSDGLVNAQWVQRTTPPLYIVNAIILFC